MEFSCERCHTSQTIADGGAGGAVARCQHCGHVNRLEAGGSAASSQGASEGDRALEDEIGAAFDSMFGEGPPSAGGGPAEASTGADATAAADTTQQEVAAASSDDDDPAGFEWYVAIDGKQVGPVSFADLKERWTRGIIGPDSLCWRMHFDEWTAIGDVPTLRAALGDPPRAAAEPGPGASSPTTLDGGATLQGEDTAGEIRGAVTGAGDGAGDVPEAEATPARWAPTAASDLSALVSDELARAEEREAQAASDPMANIPDPETTGVRVLIRDLPEAPPPEPSKFIPIPKTAPPVAEEPARPKPAAAQQRQAVTSAAKPRGGNRGLAIAAAVVLLVVGGGAAAHFTGLLDSVLGGGGPQGDAQGTAPVAAAPPREEEAPAPVEEAKKPADDVAADAAGADGEGSEALAAGDETEAKDEAGEGEAADAGPDDAQEVAEAAEKKEAEEPAEAKRAPARKATAAPKRQANRAVAQPKPKPAPAPTRRSTPPAPTRAKATAPKAAPKPAKGGDLLAAGRSNSIDALFEQEMSAPAPARRQESRGGYIPPPPGAGTQKPRALAQGDIMGVVAGQRGDLRTCANRYKEQGGTSGTVVMSWVIEPNGKTSGIRAVRGKEHAPMVSCLTGLIKDWKFPEYAGPKMDPIEFPFQF